MKKTSHIAFVLLAIALILPQLASTYWVTLITQVFIFGMLALSADLLLGNAGLFSLCHAAFFAVRDMPLLFCKCAMDGSVFGRRPLVFFLELCWAVSTACLFALEVFILFWLRWRWGTSSGAWATDGRL